MRTPIVTMVLGLAMLIGAVAPGSAHHGWAWTTGNNIELFGIVTEARLGNPHGVLKVDAEGDVWTVEVGQPWRNARAGLKEGDLAVGKEIRFIGQPSANLEDRILKAEKIYIGGRLYDLYPNRD